MFSAIDHLSFQIHGGSDHHGGGVSGTMEILLTNIENLISKEPADILASILPGLANIHNIHPLLVHFPIALLTVFFLVDFAGSAFKNSDLRRTAGWFLYLGTFGALLAVAAGLQAASTVPHASAAHEIMMQHRSYGITVASLAVLLSIWRILVRGHFGTLANLIHLGLAAITCIIMTLGADLGGLMVFKYGIASSATSTSVSITAPPHEHNHDHQHSH